VQLPVFAIRSVFEAALSAGGNARTCIVLSSPTGSGKSTEVPRWCPGRTLVIEPRRIACRSLAARVADLEETRLGEGVGYVVRDERVMSKDTRIVFATPGIVLRDRALLSSASTVILDEFHERSIETDLLLALLPKHSEAKLVIMSATLEGERVAAHVGGKHLAAEGRTFPVEIRYLGTPLLPDGEGLAHRVRSAVELALREAGDVLVFLPGKGEIEACAQALSGLPCSLVPLHGGLSLEEQRRAFGTTPQRKVILATNVAETSLTIPGVGVVIDSGLVRQTRYHDGRGFLTLVSIADDSAAQRAGRAGRTGPGICLRMWSSSARLEKITLPEIHRESLVPLVMGAAAWGEEPETLRLLDAPKPYALEAARADLAAWGALQKQGLSDAGRALFALPIAPHHARLLIAARAEGCIEDAIDLVAVLSVTKPVFVDSRHDELGNDEDLRASGCDATALVQALRAARPSDHGVSQSAVHEARQTRTRLRKMEGLPSTPAEPAPFAREAILRAALASDARIAHVARARGRDVYFSNGGTELELSRSSAARRMKQLDALLVLDTRALGSGRDQRVLITCGMPVPLALLARAGLGEERLGPITLEGKRIVASIERVLAKRVIGTREDAPQGALAREAMVALAARGSLWKRVIPETRERLERIALASRIASSGHASITKKTSEPTELEPWLLQRLESLGVQSSEDLALLSDSDLLPDELPYETRTVLDKDFPASVSVGDATYRAAYDMEKREVVLHMVKGNRKEPPPLAYLPSFAGLRVCVASGKGVAVLRERGR
jgi:ATP-dependent helicase HrpB